MENNDRVLIFRYSFVAFVLALLSVPVCRAQGLATEDHLGSDFLRPQIVAGFSDVSARVFRDIDGTYDASALTLEATVPVIGESSRSEQSGSYLLLARSRFSAVTPQISFLSYSRTLWISTVGLTGGIRTSSGHLYLLSLNGGAAEDERVIGNPRLRPTGSLLGKYQLENTFAFIYGLSYSYVFGRGLLLPMLGAHCTVAQNLAMHVILPYSFELEYNELQDLRFELVARANGDQIHVKNDNGFLPQSPVVYLKNSQVEVALNVSIELGQRWWLCGEAGISRDRRFAVGTQNDNFVSGRIENAGYSSLAVKYLLNPTELQSW